MFYRKSVFILRIYRVDIPPQKVISPQKTSRPSSAIAERPRCTAAGWISFGQKWKTIFCRQYRSIFNHCDTMACKAIEFNEIKQNKGYYAVKGHSRSPYLVPFCR